MGHRKRSGLGEEGGAGQGEDQKVLETSQAGLRGRRDVAEDQSASHRRGQRWSRRGRVGQKARVGGWALMLDQDVSGAGIGRLGQADGELGAWSVRSCEEGQCCVCSS